MVDEFDSALDLMRRLPPQHISKNVNALLQLVPHLAEDILSSVDQPLAIKQCKSTSKDYLICDYNRDGDSFRSPWSNEYDPVLPDGAQPSEKIRKLEISANESFDVYRDLYYEGGLSSVYFWDLDDGFAGVVLFKKSSSSTEFGEGGWDSIHVFEALDRSRTAHYKLTSTIILHMNSNSTELGKMDLGGNMTRHVEQDFTIEDSNSHIVNVGRMIEDMELKMRNLLQEVYFGKVKDVMNDLRSPTLLSQQREGKKIQAELVQGLSGRST